jgi:hypothetical protein
VSGTEQHGQAGASADRMRRTISAAHWRDRRRAAILGTPAAAAVGSMLGWITAEAVDTEAGVLLGAAVAGAAIGRHFHRSTTARQWGKGARGERRTGRQLRQLERQGWAVLHDRAIPGSRANLDHLLIGPPGVVYVDTKQWTSGAQAEIRHGELWYGRHNHARSLRTAAWEASQAARALDVPVRTAVSIHGQPHLPITDLTTDRAIVTVLPSHALVTWLASLPATWTTDQIRTSATRAANALPAYTR